MKLFLIWILGIMIGAPIGVVITSLMCVAGNEDRCMECLYQQMCNDKK